MFLTHNIVVRSSGGPKTFDLPTADFGCHLAGVKRVYSAFCLLSVLMSVLFVCLQLFFVVYSAPLILFLITIILD